MDICTIAHSGNILAPMLKSRDPMRPAQDLYVQYGAGHCAPNGWVNFDSSVTNRLEKIPVMGAFVNKNAKRFPPNVLYGDIVKGLPLSDACAAGIYASHVLEHLDIDAFWLALKETRRILKPGGTFRLIVPDLLGRIRLYVAEIERGDPEASIKLLERCRFRGTVPTKGLLNTILNSLRTSGHCWMWDEHSMRHALEKTGFSRVRRCSLGDAEDRMFDRAESKGRFFDHSLGIVECAMEAKRPLDPEHRHRQP
jgi:SAM-dependent methyltransferase